MTRLHQLLRPAFVLALAGLLILAIGRLGGWQTPLSSIATAQTANLEDPPADDEDPDAAAVVPPIRRLTPAEINRIRYCELRAMRITDDDRPDAVTVKIPPKTIKDFLDDMKGNQNFQGEQERREFQKLTPPKKLHLIARFDKELKYVDQVEIETDPEVFVQFRKKVLPIVLQNCATAGCHSSTNADALGFRLSKDPKKLPVSTYTNFVTLCQLTVGKHAVIDRVTPEESLLLTYMLPPKDVKVELQHPGDVKYKPGFPNRASNHYKTIENWIRTLKHPAEDYGVELVHPKAATTQPAEGEPEEAGKDEPEMRPPPTKPKPRPGA